MNKIELVSWDDMGDRKPEYALLAGLANSGVAAP